MYTVFVRTWYKKVKTPGIFGSTKLVPHMGRRKVLKSGIKDREEARQMCEEYNSTHNPGELSRKAEFTSDY